jgi:hypothetical protein
MNDQNASVMAFRLTAPAANLYVPPKYSNLSVIIEVDRILSAPLVGAARPVYRAGCSCLAIQNLGPAPIGEPRLATTTHRSAPVGTEATPAAACRSDLLGRAPARLERLAIHFDDRPAGDGPRLASESVVLVNFTWRPARQQRGPN